MVYTYHALLHQNTLSFSLRRIGDVKKVEGLSEDTTVAALMDANANNFTLGSIMLHSLNAQSVNEVKSSGLSTFPYYSKN